MSDIWSFIAGNVVVCVSLLAAAGLTALALYPPFAYFRRGWKIKKTDIVSSFSPKAKILYLNTFMNFKIGQDAPQGDAPEDVVARGAQLFLDELEANTQFEKIYLERFGRHRFVIPLLLFVLCCFAATYLFSLSAAAWISLATPKGLIPAGSLAHGVPIYIIPDVAAAGIAGAYLWIVADMISSTRRMNFAPADLLNATLRLAMSASIAVALVGTIENGKAKWFALSLAFAIGVFPLSAIRAMLRRYAANTLKLGVGIDDASKDQILNLDGIDPPAADRLLEADISTILQLAYADPVQLSMKTGLDFNVITDFESQALAWLYLGDRLNDLRPAGLRGAMEVRIFVEQLEDPGADIFKLMKALLKVAPGLPQDSPTATPPVKRTMDRAAFLNACDEIANDPYTKFLVEIWRDGDSISRDIVPDYANLLTD